MKPIDIISLKLSNLDDKIVSRKNILNIIRQVAPDKPEKYLKKLRENKKIKNIFLTYYYILSEDERKTNNLKYFTSEMVFSVLNKKNIKWYVSFEKGLELNNVVWQNYNKTTILNNKISRIYKINGLEFEFKKTKTKLISHYSQNKTRNRITQNIGSNEKIFLDYIYFDRKIPSELIEKIDIKKIKKILKDYSKGFNKKVRLFLDE